MEILPSMHRQQTVKVPTAESSPLIVKDERKRTRETEKRIEES